MLDAYELIDAIIDNGYVLEDTKVYVYEGTEASGKTTRIQEDITKLLKKGELPMAITDWDFMSEIKESKKEILSMSSKDRAEFICAMRCDMQDTTRFEDMIGTIRDMTLLVDRYFISTILLHDLDDVQWLAEVEHFLPEEIFLVVEEPQVILERLNARTEDETNDLDNLSIEDITEQQEAFTDLVDYYNEKVGLTWTTVL